MDATKRNYLLDIFMGLVFLACFITGAIQFPPLMSALGTRSWGLPWGSVQFIHQWTGMAIGIIVLAHVVLHWQWLANVTRMLFGKK